MSTTAPVVKTDTQLSAPAKTSAPLTLRQHLESPVFAAQVAKALPRHLTPDRFIRIACTTLMRTPKLANCDQASFFNSLLTLSQLGLEPDGRHAHLIPFRNNTRNCTECQLIIDWKGLAALAMRSGLVSNLHADVVREGDLLEYSAGKLKAHVPHFLRRDAAKPAAEGKLFAVYCVAEFKDGSSKADVMSLAEVNAIRARSRSGQSGPWVTDYNEMAKKTVFRRLSKWLPLSPEFRDALDADADAIDVVTSTAATDPKAVDGLAAMLASGSSEAEVREEKTVTEIKAEPGSNPDLESASPAPTSVDREALITAMQNKMLDLSVTEERLWKYAVEGKHVPEGIDELWALPTDILAKLQHAIAAVAQAKGGK